MLYTEPGTMLGLREEVGTEEGSATPRGREGLLEVEMDMWGLVG